MNLLTFTESFTPYRILRVGVEYVVYNSRSWGSQTVWHSGTKVCRELDFLPLFFSVDDTLKHIFSLPEWAQSAFSNHSFSGFILGNSRL